MVLLQQYHPCVHLDYIVCEQRRTRSEKQIVDLLHTAYRQKNVSGQGHQRASMHVTDIFSTQAKIALTRPSRWLCGKCLQPLLLTLVLARVEETERLRLPLILLLHVPLLRALRLTFLSQPLKGVVEHILRGTKDR